MATIVNNPGSNDSGGGMGFLLGIIILIVVGVLFFIYGLPLIQQGTNQGTQNQGTQVDVPKDINVNVKQAE